MLVSVPKPAPLVAQRIRHEHIAVLAAQLALRVVEQVLRLHREAAQKLSRPLVHAERARISGFRARRMFSSPSPF